MNNQTAQRTRQFILVLSFRAHELDDKEEVISDIPFNRASPRVLHMTKLGDGKITDNFIIRNLFLKSLDVNLRVLLTVRQDLEVCCRSFDTTPIVST